MEVDAARRMPGPKYIMNLEKLLESDETKDKEEIIEIHYDGKDFYWILENYSLFLNNIYFNYGYIEKQFPQQV